MRTSLSILILLALTVISVSAQSHVTQVEAVALMNGSGGSAPNGTANEIDMINMLTSASGWGGPDNPQTGTTYTVLEEDAGRLLTLSNASAIAVTLPQAGTTGFEDGSWFLLKNIGAGTVTVTPTTSTIDGGATLVLLSGHWASIHSDGTNYRSLLSTEDQTATEVANDYAGGDCGAKINAALSSAGAYGVVLVDQSCGTTWTTAVVASAFQVIRFVQGGTYLLQNTVTAGHIEGTGFGAPHITGNAPTRLKQDDSQNLAFIVKVNTDAGSIRNLEIDGNKANNTGSTDAIWIDGARGVLLDSVYAHSADGHGIYVKSTTTANNDAGITKVVRSVIYDHDGDCYHSEDALDAFLSLSEFESCAYGIYLEDSGAARIEGGDIAGNTTAGLYATGTTGQLLSSFLIILGNQFGNGASNDLVIDGHDGTGYVSITNTIMANVFFGGGNRTSNTTDAIRLEDSYNNTVIGNVINSETANTYRYGIRVVDTGSTVLDTWFANRFTGTFGTGEELGKAGLTVSCNGDCNVFDMGVMGGDLYLGGGVGVTGSTLFLHAGGFELGGVTGNQFNFGQAGVSFYVALDTSGNWGVSGNYGFSSGTAYDGTFDHAITADRTWTMPDATGTVALTTGVSETCGSGLASVTIVSGIITAATCN